MSTTKRNRRNVASVCHAIAEARGIDPEQVAAIAAEIGAKKVADEARLVEAVDAWVAAQSAPADEPEAPKVKKERQPSLTLSQRRALRRLLDGAVSPATAFKALPYEHLVECGYAVKGDDGYTLTDAGTARAESTNPGYVVWAAGESVAGDPNRPPAGTKLGIHDLEPEVATQA